jgi:hypothetical protein
MDAAAILLDSTRESFPRPGTLRGVPNFLRLALGLRGHREPARVVVILGGTEANRRDNNPDSSGSKPQVDAISRRGWKAISRTFANPLGGAKPGDWSPSQATRKSVGDGPGSSERRVFNRLWLAAAGLVGDGREVEARHHHPPRREMTSARRLRLLEDLGDGGLEAAQLGLDPIHPGINFVEAGVDVLLELVDPGVHRLGSLPKPFDRRFDRAGPVKPGAEAGDRQSKGCNDKPPRMATTMLSLVESFSTATLTPLISFVRESWDAAKSFRKSLTSSLRISVDTAMSHPSP